MPGFGKVWLAVLFASAFMIAPGPASAGEAPNPAPSVAVTGEATLQFAPDTVEVTVAVVTRAPTADEAATENASAMSRVSQALKEALSDKGELRTVGYRVQAIYEYDRPAKRNRFVAFEASNRVRVRSQDVKGVGSLLDAAIKAGANSIDGPNWSLAKPGEAVTQAQTEAFKNAQAQARNLAAAAGLKLGKVLSIEAGQERRFREPMLGFKTSAAPADSTPVEAGSITVSASVNCVFSLEADKQ